MATWLAYLKSKLLLPEDDEEEFKALEVAEKLKVTIKKTRINQIIIRPNAYKKKIRSSYFYKRNERWN